MWWIHDYRLEIHRELNRKAREYKDRQREILEKTEQEHQERMAQLQDSEYYSSSEASESEPDNSDTPDNIPEVNLEHK